MKKSIFKLLLIMIIISTRLSAQKNQTGFTTLINSKIKISVNGHLKKDTAYQIRIKNLTLHQEKTLHTSNITTIFFDYNMEYELYVTYTGCNTKIIEVNTNAPIDKWFIITSINLSSKVKSTIRAGKINYDKGDKTFKTKGNRTKHGMVL